MRLRGKINDIPQPGVKIKVTAPYITKNKIGYIDYYDKESKKWKISFDNNWVGWYRRIEFELIE